MILAGRSRNRRVKPELPSPAPAKLDAPSTVNAVLTTSKGEKVTTTTEDGRVVVYMRDPESVEALTAVLFKLEEIADLLRGLNAA